MLRRSFHVVGAVARRRIGRRREIVLEPAEVRRGMSFASPPPGFSATGPAKVYLRVGVYLAMDPLRSYRSLRVLRTRGEEGEEDDKLNTRSRPRRRCVLTPTQEDDSGRSKSTTSGLESPVSYCFACRRRPNRCRNILDGHVSRVRRLHLHLHQHQHKHQHPIRRPPLHRPPIPVSVGEVGGYNHALLRSSGSEGSSVCSTHVPMRPDHTSQSGREKAGIFSKGRIRISQRIQTLHVQPFAAATRDGAESTREGREGRIGRDEETSPCKP
ncbi:hypothetical protein LZ30DRAFT_53302 [Colletotrichum cereale]|nr:hypothetical protein LZ30DRAFT_53302 [Colletotrichum cereale]